jgi:8-oxo-dGTP pyrophosphatase MutT (NUDIX family)
MIEHYDELEYEKRARAGLIPYLKDEHGVYKYLMMVSSNPKLGGPRPMLSKGKIEDDEDAFGCAVREAEEELGLVRYNLTETPFLIAKERVVLRSGAYDLTVYAAGIIDRWHFDKWCTETEYTVWMSKDEFLLEGRRDHQKYVVALEEILRNREVS